MFVMYHLMIQDIKTLNIKLKLGSPLGLVPLSPSHFGELNKFGCARFIVDYSFISIRLGLFRLV